MKKILIASLFVLIPVLFLSGCSFLKFNDNETTTSTTTKVTLSYELNGGTSDSKLVYSYSKNKVIEESDIINVSYEGKLLNGWYLDSNHLSKVEFPYTLTKNTTFYAAWKNAYTVTYNSNGGAKVKNSVGVKVINELPQLTREGYDFIGWSLDGSQSTLVEVPYNVPEEGVELKAIWKFIETGVTYTVTFDTQGGLPIESMNVSFIDEYNMPTPKKDGYNFKGWYFDEKFTTQTKTYYPYILGGNVTVYALWEYEAPKDDANLTAIKNQFKNFSFDFLVRLCGYYGLGVERGYTYKNYTYTGEDIIPFNTPTETSAEYIKNDILVHGTNFDSIRNCIYDGTNINNMEYDSFVYNVTLTTIKAHWWDYDDINDLLTHKKEYVDNFLDNNLEKFESDVIGMILKTKGVLNVGVNDFTVSDLDKYYDLYLQNYSYLGFSDNDRKDIRGLLSYRIGTNLSELDLDSVLREILTELIANDNAPYHIQNLD